MHSTHHVSSNCSVCPLVCHTTPAVVSHPLSLLCPFTLQLHLANEEITNAGLGHLSKLTGLTRLSLDATPDIRGQALSTLLVHLPHLTTLQLRQNLEFDDACLAACVDAMCSVTHLDLHSTWVTEQGLMQLTRLPHLQKLSFAPHHEMWCDYLSVMSSLTQLTSLAIHKCSFISYHLMECLSKLSRLQELDMSSEDAAVTAALVASGGASPDAVAGAQEPISTLVIDVLAGMSSLTSINLSHRPVLAQHLTVLCERLPRLQNLVTFGCPVEPIKLRGLESRFAHMTIQRQPPRVAAPPPAMDVAGTP